MRRETAYKIAIDALTKERQKVAFDFNLSEYYYPTTSEKSNAAKKYQRITEAIKILRREP